MSTPSIRPSSAPQVRYVLRIADTCLILAQRLSEWCGHAPVLEEDIALTNMSLDLVGQARALFTHAGQLGAADTQGVALDEDQLAFLREERDYLNPTLVELPNAFYRAGAQPGDFAFTVLRNAVVSTWLLALWTRLADSSDAELVAIAGKAVKEARYHQQHAADWVVRLGDGTADSAARMQAALNEMWRYLPELFQDDEVDAFAAEAKLGPAWSSLKDEVMGQMGSLLAEAKLTPPSDSSFRNGFQSKGRNGIHSEHLGFILSEMQYLQRAYPGGVW